MAPHSSTLAWKIPWTEEPGGLQSKGSLRVGHDSDFIFTFHFHTLEMEGFHLLVSNILSHTCISNKLISDGWNSWGSLAPL